MANKQEQNKQKLLEQAYRELDAAQDHPSRMAAIDKIGRLSENNTATKTLKAEEEVVPYVSAGGVKLAAWIGKAAFLGAAVSDLLIKLNKLEENLQATSPCKTKQLKQAEGTAPSPGAKGIMEQIKGCTDYSKYFENEYDDKNIPEHAGDAVEALMEMANRTSSLAKCAQQQYEKFFSVIPVQYYLLKLLSDLSDQVGDKEVLYERINSACKSQLLSAESETWADKTPRLEIPSIPPLPYMPIIDPVKFIETLIIDAICFVFCAITSSILAAISEMLFAPGRPGYITSSSYVQSFYDSDGNIPPLKQVNINFYLTDESIQQVIDEGVVPSYNSVDKIRAFLAYTQYVLVKNPQDFIFLFFGEAICETIEKIIKGASVNAVSAVDKSTILNQLSLFNIKERPIEDLITILEGKTSYNAGALGKGNHQHTYVVDKDGNGVAKKVCSPDSNKICHEHKIVDGVVQNSYSSCWPDCEKLYGADGVGPHAHIIYYKHVDSVYNFSTLELNDDASIIRFFTRLGQFINVVKFSNDSKGDSCDPDPCELKDADIINIANSASALCSLLDPKAPLPPIPLGLILNNSGFSAIAGDQLAGLFTAIKDEVRDKLLFLQKRSLVPNLLGTPTLPPAEALMAAANNTSSIEYYHLWEGKRVAKKLSHMDTTKLIIRADNAGIQLIFRDKTVPSFSSLKVNFRNAIFDTWGYSWGHTPPPRIAWIPQHTSGAGSDPEITPGQFKEYKILPFDEWPEAAQQPGPDITWDWAQYLDLKSFYEKESKEQEGKWNPSFGRGKAYLKYKKGMETFLKQLEDKFLQKADSLAKFPEYMIGDLDTSLNYKFFEKVIQDSWIEGTEVLLKNKKIEFKPMSSLLGNVKYEFLLANLITRYVQYGYPASNIVYDYLYNQADWPMGPENQQQFIVGNRSTLDSVEYDEHPSKTSMSMTAVANTYSSGKFGPAEKPEKQYGKYAISLGINAKDVADDIDNDAKNKSIEPQGDSADVITEFLIAKKAFEDMK